MKITRLLSFIVALTMLLMLSACSADDKPGSLPESESESDTPSVVNNYLTSKSTGQIFLYGEVHAIDSILDKEFELWYEYYHNEDMRHLFIEQSYYTAEFLNVWMQEDNDDILNKLYDDWAGTMSQTPATKEFYIKIKRECPNTIFHGTDVGHMYDTTGERYLSYLETNDLKDSPEYLLAQEAIEQGKTFYERGGDVYRENKMTENFIREIDSLNGESVMGIYGAAHTGVDALDYTNSIPCMANQLHDYYGEVIHSEDLSWMAIDITPARIDTITVNEKEYEASYFGRQETYWIEDYTYRDIWRLENAYGDFKNNSKTGNVLPCEEYPMFMEEGQVFIIDYIKTDGSIEREYHRTDGNYWEGMPVTEEFTVE